MEFLYKFCYGLTTVFGIAQGLFVLYKNPRSRINVTWAVMSFAVATWAWAVVRSFFERDHASALFLMQISQNAAMFIPVFFTHFCLALLNKPLRENRIALAGYVFSILMTPFVWTRWFIPTITPKLFFRYYADVGPLFVAYTVEFFVLVAYSHWLLFTHLRRQSSERQNQIKYVTAATVIGFACGSTTFLLTYNVPINPLPSLLTWLYALIITYAIVKHHLMDITIVVRKSLVYSILVALMTAVYLAMVVLIERVFAGFIGYRSVVGTVAAAFVIALGFIPVRNAVQRWVDRLFFGGSQVKLAEENERLREEVARSERLKSVALLASGLAHEIKNPLTAIKLFTELLPARYHEPEFREKFTRIVGQEVDKIHHIVQNLLTFAKPQELERKPVALAEVAQDTLTLLSADCVKRRVETEFHADPALRVMGDRTKLKQALLNLCLNSLEAMQEGGRLRVEAHRVNGHAVLAVQDTGPGIASKDLPRVFDPFFTTKDTGTGLGLSVVHGIIKDHRGKVRIHTRPGAGTIVRLELPISEK